MNKVQVISELKKLVSKGVWDFLVDCNAMVVGGALTSILTRKEVNDLDIYFRSENDFAKAVMSIYKDEWGMNLRFANSTDKSMTFNTNNPKTGDQIKIQFIHQAFYSHIVDVFDDFDFTINMVGYDFCTEEVVINKHALQHMSQRTLVINAGTKYPLMSMMRIQKYVDRGYTVSKKEVAKLLLKITSMKLESYEDVKRQIGGMYGQNIDKLIDTSQPFSIEEVIRQFDALEYTAYEDMHFEPHTLYDIISSLREPIDLTGFPYIKIVHTDETGRLHSWYKKDFTYTVGEVVTPEFSNGIFGGGGGIYCTQDYDQLSSGGKNKTGRKILVLEPCEGTVYNRDRFVGPVKVVDVVDEFESHDDWLSWLYVQGLITLDQKDRMQIYMRGGEMYSGGICDALQELAMSKYDKDGSRLPKGEPLPDLF